MQLGLHFVVGVSSQTCNVLVTTVEFVSPSYRYVGGGVDGVIFLNAFVNFLTHNTLLTHNILFT